MSLDDETRVSISRRSQSLEARDQHRYTWISISPVTLALKTPFAVTREDWREKFSLFIVVVVVVVVVGRWIGTRYLFADINFSPSPSLFLPPSTRMQRVKSFNKVTIQRTILELGMILADQSQHRFYRFQRYESLTSTYNIVTYYIVREINITRQHLSS